MVYAIRMDQTSRFASDSEQSDSWAVSTQKDVFDHSCRAYHLVCQAKLSCCQLIISAEDGHPLGRIVITFVDRIGTISELHANDVPKPWLPVRLHTKLAELFPYWGPMHREFLSMLIIHGLQTCCELKIRTVIAPAPIPHRLRSLYRDLGFSLIDSSAGTSASYRISD